MADGGGSAKIMRAEENFQLSFHYHRAEKKTTLFRLKVYETGSMELYGEIVNIKGFRLLRG